MLRGFEVENLWLGRRGVARVIRSIPGARVTRTHWCWWSRDDFCEFELNGVRFVVDEPFGDNSRYWISPAEEGHDAELLIVRERFLSLVRPEWISARLLTGVLLLSAGASMMRLPARGPAPFEDIRQVIAALSAIAGGVVLLWWGLALVRGEYRSRAIEAFRSPRRRG